MHPILEQAKVKINGLLNIQMVARLICPNPACCAVVWELVGGMMFVQAAARSSRSKNGLLKLMNRVVTSDVMCPKCGFTVIRLKGLNSGIIGKVSTNVAHENKAASNSEVSHG